MIKNLNKSGILILLLLLAAAGLTTWLRTRPDMTIATDTAPAIRQIDFFMENFRIRQYDDRGQLHYTLQGKQLNQDQQNNYAEISQPELQLKRQDSHWSVQADQAITSGDKPDEIRFLGNVRMQQMDTLGPITGNNIGGTITADSLQTDLKTGIHTLSGVKGRYAR